ncbi:DUF1330 domain-containing protein [Bradyrhizobium sp. 192]|uniref:DUF1330 domain-containing protein n=1 Tax=Bradyrhizobium sp. 192 TaxID=2782660 RepID=UPI001FFE9882|nr:DUF1330 domain-containing protein [Bradyrhizobium sp. 192]UPJ58686.1 DUF1330 domain-containing protein [Bradyrhizobium sp. 192]
MKAYFVLDITVHDYGRFKTYLDAIPAIIARHNGKYIVQGVEPTPLEGEWKHERLVVIEFSSRTDAEALLNDPEAHELFAIRHASTTGRLLLADGCT